MYRQDDEKWRERRREKKWKPDGIWVPGHSCFPREGLFKNAKDQEAIKEEKDNINYTRS